MTQIEAYKSETLSQHESFEDLLLNISAKFINLPTEEIDGAIEETQGLICSHLGLDLSALWQWSEQNDQLMVLTHLHSPPYGPKRPVDLNAAEAFPWLLNKLSDGNTFVFSTEALPEEAMVDKISRRFFGVKSSIALPLKPGNGPLLGILSFDTLLNEKTWSDRQIRRFELVAQVFFNALSRKNTDRKLIQSESRLALAIESAEAGIWDLDYQSQVFWATDYALELFGYPVDKVIDMAFFKESVHPDDRVMVQKVISDSFEKNEKFKVEYRIAASGNEWKWICSCGRPYYHSDGSPERMLGISADISNRKQLEVELKSNFEEIKALKEQVEQENHYLREELKVEKGFEHIIGQSKEFRTVLTSGRQVAPTDATVLLLGETGTGKGVVAHAIHKMSERRNKPFVNVNCAALPLNLIESELFGREKGAFTDAYTKQAGRFEVANQGTIFLDEIGEMSLETQTKLLRVLQDGMFERLGSPKSIKVNVRVIAATARDLKEDVKNGKFREDLYYRLKVFPIVIPPLRERVEDIPLLTQYFIEKYSRKMGRNINNIPK
ncbi:MAG: sigma 54-interacting transcriptional regulator, partial [Desulforhopalus sp.]